MRLSTPPSARLVYLGVHCDGACTLNTGHTNSTSEVVLDIERRTALRCVHRIQATLFPRLTDDSFFFVVMTRTSHGVATSKHG